VGGRIGSSAAIIALGFWRSQLTCRLCLLVLALIVSMAGLDPDGALMPYSIITLLALAMGLQNAPRAGSALPDLTTTVLTLTPGLGSPPTRPLRGGKNPHPGRPLLALPPCSWALPVGAFLVFMSVSIAVLALAFALLVLNGIATTDLVVIGSVDGGGVKRRSPNAASPSSPRSISRPPPPGVGYMPLLMPHFTSSQFAGYVVRKPKIIPICHHEPEQPRSWAPRAEAARRSGRRPSN